MRGFLTADAPTKKPLPLVAQCGICQLFKGCKSPKMPVDGKGRKKILIVAEAPGKEEDEQNKPLVGPSGQTLWSTLAKFGVERDDCWITNAAICRPPENKLPPAAIGYCRPNVVKAIQELKPRKVILLGASAIKSIVGWLWREDVGSAERWFGWTIPCQKINAWLIPTWHPSAFNYMSVEQSVMARLFFEKHLEAACELKGRPWPEGPPDFGKMIHLLYDPDKAADAVDEAASGTAPISFDFETNMIHPDGADAEVICCSVSDGHYSYAFPWHGKVVESMRNLVRSNVPKYGWACKFETRWCRKVLGTSVKNWQWDGMISTHVLDNRPAICGLDFQAFARLGLPEWDEHVAPFMKGKSGSKKNRLREVPLDRLMTYCGLDSLLEHRIAEIQRKEAGL